MANEEQIKILEQGMAVCFLILAAWRDYEQP